MPLKIMVAVKRVLDPQIKARLNADRSQVELENVKMSMNPFDEVAVEEAVRMRDGGLAEEVIAVSLGPARSDEILRSALAVGIDRALRVDCPHSPEPQVVAGSLRVLVEREGCGLVILGKQAIDDDCNQTGQMLAAFLGWAQGTFASRIEIDGDRALVTREVDGGLETVRLKMPAVITVDLRLNEPRYASLPNIMKARKKPLEVLQLGDLGIDGSPRLEQQGLEEPPPRRAGVILPDVASLVDRLKNEAGVI